ncbi:uncharacterized protein A1O5_10631 [Cladophialophora psammophila CBS 110553]|uniref:Transcription factor domain-containing protein n=1 Tax=Cladophialophora psammophila CBS 110553 TaxID=1182543 RepID=W9X7P8_9EURO|nr:uncharacterized protein A1O5_10631 [Cladophialophora psammophila CBS 110553]EXJ66479.1 hypothetical protein A1O5_10631 [Cladophialophora psammophila CBS 110553]
MRSSSHGSTDARLANSNKCLLTFSKLRDDLKPPKEDVVAIDQILLYTEQLIIDAIRFSSRIFVTIGTQKGLLPLGFRVSISQSYQYVRGANLKDVSRSAALMDGIQLLKVLVFCQPVILRRLNYLELEPLSAGLYKFLLGTLEYVHSVTYATIRRHGVIVETHVEAARGLGYNVTAIVPEFLQVIEGRLKSSARFDAMMVRMSRFEESIRQSVGLTAPPSTTSSEGNDRLVHSVPEDPPVARRAKRQREAATDGGVDGEYRPQHNRSPAASISVVPAPRAQNAPQSRMGLPDEGPSPEDRALGATDLRRYLQPTPQSSLYMGAERRSILEAAIQMAQNAALLEPSSDTVQTDPAWTPNFYESSMCPTAEFMHLVLSGYSQNSAIEYYLDLNRNASKEGLEKMVCALIDCSVHGQERLCYLILVNYVAYSFITALNLDNTSDPMKQHLRLSKARYRQNITRALKHLDIQIRPDPLLLQALISGAMLMQDVGDMRRGWQLNTVACRVYAAVSRSSDGVLGHDPELPLVMIKCFIFDKALSANMYQPACLPSVELDSSILNPSQKPSHAILFILLEYAKVQEIIIFETRIARDEKLIRPENLLQAQNRMREIRLEAQQRRSRMVSFGDDYLESEFLGVEFVFHSTMTSLTKLSTRSDDDVHTYNECLQHARNALSTLKRLLQLTLRQSSCQGLYINSLSWIVPLFTLRPLYHLFSNLVATSNALDLKLIQDVGKDLAALPKELGPIQAVGQLCISFDKLYTEFSEKIMSLRTLHSEEPSQRNQPAFATNSHFNNQSQSLAPGHRSTAPTQTLINNQTTGNESGVNQFGQILAPSATPVMNTVLDHPRLAMDLDWELFSVQPSLDFPDLDLGI